MTTLRLTKPQAFGKASYKWPTTAELDAAFPGRTLRDEFVQDMARRVHAAFDAGAEFVSLTNGVQEVGRIYRDGRHWSPP